MIITIVDTKFYGKFVLHKYPYDSSLANFEGLQKLSPLELLNYSIDSYGYFGVYKKKQLITTSQAPLNQKSVMEIFMASEKFSQVVLGIDDDCVLISKSIFMNIDKPSFNSSKGYALGSFESENVQFCSVEDQSQSIINSISVVFKQESYDKIEDTKYKLTFLIGVLEQKQSKHQYLTKQIHKIMEHKKYMCKKIEDLLSINNKESNTSYEEMKIKINMKDIYDGAKLIRQSIHIFNMIGHYYESCWIKKVQYVVKDEHEQWEGTIGRSIQISIHQQSWIKTIQHKTIVVIPPKLNEILPNVLHSDRLKKIYEKGLSLNNVSLKKVLEKNKDLLAKQELYHSVHFLLINNLAVDIYPINFSMYYNLFTLIDVPPRVFIDKCNSKTFPGSNCIGLLSEYSNYRIVKQEEETLKYFLLKGIIKEIQIYIYKKEQIDINEHLKVQEEDVVMESTLDKYSMTQFDINYIASVEPQIHINSLLNYIMKHPKMWGFYFVE